jgi:phosphoribosylaminoimidazole-succinocarboxamide synthase
MVLTKQQLNSGKVRDIYQIGDNHLLLVATDRVSAFDVVLPTLIPEKGKVLNSLSESWFNNTSDIIQNHWHMAEYSWQDLPFSAEQREAFEGRAMLVKKCLPLPIEAIVRGYLTASVYNEYKERGFICGIPHPLGLRLGERLPEPIYTPTTKAPPGEHDKNITFGETAAIESIGGAMAERIRKISLSLYEMAYEIALKKGVIIADTKFEFGIDPDTGSLVLIDELLTPDSSRYWNSSDYNPGTLPKSMDKQIVRDYLLLTGWDKNPPAPELPDNIVRKMIDRYEFIQSLFADTI